MSTPQDIAEATLAHRGEQFQVARLQVVAIRENLVQAVQEGHAAGLSEVRLAEVAGVDRMTVRAWLGKPQKRRAKAQRA